VSYLPDDCKIKGSLIKGLLFYMQKKWGKTYVESLKLPFKIDEIKDGKYYPYSWMRAVHHELLKKNPGKEEIAFRNAGRSVVEATMEGKFFVNYIVRKRPLEKTISDLLKAWEKESFEGVFKGRSTKNENKILITLDQMCDDRGEEVCWLNLGGIEGIIKVSGKNATVKHTKCIFHGDERCVYEIELND